MNERMSERTNKQTNERKEGINSLLPKAKTDINCRTIHTVKIKSVQISAGIVSCSSDIVSK